MAGQRTATMATISGDGRPRLVPLCFVVERPTASDGPVVLWSPLDAKPKRDADVRRLARVRDIEARPEVTLLFDRWSEDWTELAWVRASGHATIVEPRAGDPAHTRAVSALRAKYPQYRSQPIDRLPMIRITVTDVTRWTGKLARSGSER